MSELAVLLPPGVDDPRRPSGGNRVDRIVCDGLAALGLGVREHVVPGAWPRPGAVALRALTEALGTVPDDGLVLLDGLIASAAGDVLAAAAGRLRLVVLVHMPQPDGAVGAVEEARALAAARAVLTTSAWTRERLVADEGLPPDRVHVALPGVDAAPLAAGTPAGGSLLAVGAVVPHKGHDVLLEALLRLEALDWRCTIAGPLDRDAAHVARLRRAARPLGDRIRLAGTLHGAELAGAYAAADLLVLPSRTESFGLVVLEALAAGLPVVASDVGGVPEALGHDAHDPPGLVVPPEDPGALTEALQVWLGDAALRHRLRAAAVARRAQLPGWDRTVAAVAGVLAEVGA